jgi:hypothetical protein
MMTLWRRDRATLLLECVVALGVTFACNAVPLTVDSAQAVLDEALGEGAAEAEAIWPGRRRWRRGHPV